MCRLEIDDFCRTLGSRVYFISWLWGSPDQSLWDLSWASEIFTVEGCPLGWPSWGEVTHVGPCFMWVQRQTPHFKNNIVYKLYICSGSLYCSCIKYPWILMQDVLFCSVSLQTRDRICTGGSVVDCRGLLESEGCVPPGCWRSHCGRAPRTPFHCVAYLRCREGLGDTTTIQFPCL